MDKKIFKDDRFFVAGASGMAGSAICRSLKKNGYGDINNGGNLFTPSRNELNLLNINEVEDWFNLNKPSVVVIAAAKVGGIFANSSMPTEFLLENLKIQTNIIETSWKKELGDYFFLGAAAFILNSQPNRLRKNHFYLVSLSQLINGMQLQKFLE